MVLPAIYQLIPVAIPVLTSTLNLHLYLKLEVQIEKNAKSSRFLVCADGRLIELEI
jgi:hypothetical protein